ncbi:MAG: hypothetical protein WKH68_00605 [Candidatus Limnocylindria bacterium]
MARRSARTRVAWALLGLVLLLVVLLGLVTMSVPTFWCGSCNQ